MSNTVPNQPDEQDRSVFDWVSLNKFSSLPILSVGYYGTALVPLISVGIVYANETISWAAFLQFLGSVNPDGKGPSFGQMVGAMAMFQQKLEIGWSLIFLYSASVSLALGKLLNSARCPKKISAHKSYTNYVSYLAEMGVALSEITNQMQMANAEQVTRSVRRHASNLPLGSISLDGGRLIQSVQKRMAIEANGPILLEFSEQIRELLQDHRSKWHSTNFSRPITRAFIVALYAISAVSAISVFLFLAPLQVCSATSLGTVCDVPFNFIGELLSKLKDAFFELLP